MYPPAPPQQPLLSRAELDRYLRRIDYSGKVTPTLESLVALHRAHLYAVSYENLDIHLGRRLSLDPRHIFEKIVDERRGGWCYEMNGIFGRVLDAIGFSVTRVSGAVGRATRGEAAEGNHLVLLVDLDDSWIVDVGFGDGFLEPLPLAPGTYRQGFLDYSVERDGERWSVGIHEFATVNEFDFTTEAREMSHFQHQCDALQSSPESGFVQKTICERFVPGGLISLRGAMLTEIRDGRVEKRIIETANEYRAILHDGFDLAVPDTAALFDTVWQRHLEWQREQDAASNQV